MCTNELNQKEIHIHNTNCNHVSFWFRDYKGELLTSDDNYYFDSGKQQKINYPGFNNITQIEFVLAKENTSRIDEDRITGYNGSTLAHEENSKTYTITNIPRNINTYYITYNTTNDDIGKKLVIDEVRISYVC